jgi:NAD(P)-dependent dehydrogenase (short-subunit alcohol dehydrogenase family)
MTMSTPPRVWLVTGAGRGLGRAFVTGALRRGDRVVATVRDDRALDDLTGEFPEALRVLVLDVRDRAAVRRIVDKAVEQFQRLDVVVNNAGYGIVGMTEEVSEREVRDHLDTNLLGALWVTQAVLPQLRKQRSGHIVQISSVGGVGAMPGLGLYNTGKWALEAFSEALAGEVASFGVRVTIAQPAGFATDWGGASMQFAEPLPVYDELRRSLFGAATVPWKPAPIAADSTEPPPAAATAVLLAHLDQPDGPLRLLIGQDAPEQVAAALAIRRDDYARDPRFLWPGV